METDKYAGLLEKLRKELNWPTVYMFKFIVVSDNHKIALVQSRFSDEATISQKESNNGKYMSITVKEVMLSPESVIDKYREMENIEGVMAL